MTRDTGFTIWACAFGRKTLSWSVRTWSGNRTTTIVMTMVINWKQTLSKQSFNQNENCRTIYHSSQAVTLWNGIFFNLVPFSLNGPQLTYPLTFLVSSPVFRTGHLCYSNLPHLGFQLPLSWVPVMWSMYFVSVRILKVGRENSQNLDILLHNNSQLIHILCSLQVVFLS